MNQTSHHDGASSRQERRLTITYYIEPRSMRQLTIPVRSANIIVVVVSASLVWLLASFVFMGISLVRGGFVMRVPSRIAPSIAASALSRQENGVERTPKTPTLAPSGAPSASDSVDNTLSAKVIASTDRGDSSISIDEARLEEPVASVPDAKTSEVLAVAGLQKVELTAGSTAEPKSTASMFEPAAEAGVDGALGQVSVDKPSFIYDAGHLTSQFWIKNASDETASGKVWGVALFRSGDGQTVAVSSHPNSEVGLNYKARHLTEKTLRFPYPTNAPSHLAELRIYVSERKAQSRLVTTYIFPE